MQQVLDVNITFDKKLDEAQFHELKRQFDSGTSFNKEAFMEHAHDRVCMYGASWAMFWASCNILPPSWRHLGAPWG